MSHSQFHSTNLFILRHAWLNLWDKHMTTGRINQVTTFQYWALAQALLIFSSLKNYEFRSESSLNLVWDADYNLTKASSRTVQPTSSYNQTALFPVLTISRHFSTCHSTATDIKAFIENYQQPAMSTKDYAQSRRIFNWLNATDLAISK
jgi:hypothetical protein